jgi:mannose-1-phosphate guanylyltransferase
MTSLPSPLSHAFAVIMAGGSGTRFWPLSRRGRPKQFLPLTGSTPLLRMTFERIRPLIPARRILVVTAQDTAGAVRRMLPELPAGNVIAEPAGRNTAPCIGVAAGVVRRRDPRAVLAVFPSDHAIGDPAAFRAELARALRQAARAPVLVTLGIRPTYPATGYGYIEAGPKIAPSSRFHAVRRFREKPSLPRARRYSASGRHWWNAGIFAWGAGTVLDALRTHHPELGRRLDALAAGPFRPADIARAYPAFPSISIDYAVLEKARNVVVLPVRFPWDDVGAWDAIADHHRPDERGNVRVGPACVVDAAGNLLVAGDGRVVAALGVRDLIVVHTPDATLVCPRGRSQDIRRVVEELQRSGRTQFL